MNGRKKGKKRFASACMAFLMAVSGLPLSETVYATESAPADVSISWTASRKEKNSHAGTVTLQAENRTEEDVIVGIRLDPEEEKALASPLPNGVELLTYEELKSSAKPSPSPTPSADPSPSPSQSPSVSPAPSTEPTAGASSTPEATGDPGETEEPEGTEEPESTREPAPSQTPESTKTPTEPTPEESIAPQPAESAQPSSAPEAEASAEPAQIPESTPPAAAEEPTGNLITDEVVSQEPVIIQNLSAFTETQGADESGAEAAWLPLVNTAETGPSVKAPEEGTDEKYIAFTLKANGSVNYSFDFETDEPYQKIAIENKDVVVFPEEAQISLEAQPLILGDPAKWQIELTAEKTTDVPIADGKAVVPDMAFTLIATLLEEGFTKAQTVMFNLTLPEGLSLPEGQLRVENGEILAGNAVVAELSGLPADAQVELPDNPNGVSFTVTRTDEMNQALDKMTLKLTVKGGALVCDEALYNNTATPIVSLTAQAMNDGEPSMTQTAQTKLNIVPEEPSVGVSDTEELTKNIYWCDNNGEGGKRPANADIHPTLYFTIDGGEKVKLDLSTMAQVGLTEMPKFVWNGNSFTVEVPTEISIDNGYGQVTTKAVQWEMEAPQFEGYEFVEINADNQDQYPAAGGKFGWYYLLTDDFSFTINLRMGDAQAPTSVQVCDLLKNFEFHWQYGSTNQTVSFAQLEEDGHFSYDRDTGTVSVPGIWKYNVDGSPISFWIDENSEFSESMSIPSEDAADLLEGDDTLLITYSNAGVPNSASVTDRVYSGGQLNLTRTGTTGYTATKEWLDEDNSVRPTATFTLWRYREGAGFGTAAQVRDSSGRLLTFSISPDSDENRENTYTITFTENGDSVELPKYDQDGYAYVYVVREELTYGASGGDRYEQVFGKVTEDEDGTVTVADTLPEGETRTAGNTFLYNDGTLSNRLTGTVSVSATKTWKAAAYQADFEDVAVELMLQQKPADESGDWTTAQRNGAPITAVLYNFYAESMSNTAQSSVPQYDALGRELEYRWVETAVYQGKAIEALSDDASSAEIQAALDQSKKIVVDADGRFELEQAMEGEEEAQTVGYVSETKTNGNSTTIENSLTDTIDYRVKKVWHDANGGETKPDHDVTIQIYQTTNGGQGDLNTPYVSFQIKTDGTITVVTDSLPDGVQVEDLEDGAEWDAVVKNLPKYDAEGHLYEYILLEAGGKDNWFPTYDTVRDPETGDYATTVFNGLGTGERIFVRKVWVDDGDVLHREPVTFGVYYKEGGDGHQAGGAVLRLNGEPVTLTLQDGVWHDFIGLPQGVNAEDVYVVETTMGDAEVKYNKANSTIPTEDELLAGFVTVGSEEKIFEAATQNHRYQVTYEKESTPANFNAHSAYTITNRRLGVINLKVQKTWLDGESDVVEQLSDVLADIYKKENKQLALVFKLQFADKQDGWKITYNGIDGAADSVQVGGEKVHILDKEGKQTSSEQSIIGINKDGQVQKSDAAAFYNLPKYDSTGGVVQYTVEEVWIETSGERPPIELSNTEIEEKYPELYAIWKEYRSRSEVSYDLEGDQHDQDHQTMEVTNYRTAVKDVVWYKEWKDDFTANQSLRPDIYLDIYRVVHKPNPDYEAENPDTEQYIEQIELVLENYKWSDNDNEDGQDADEQAGSNSWIVTLSDMEKYDAYGFEIQYYAVERTLVHASDYDYQAAQYSIMEGSNEVQLGNRDTPSKGAETAGRVLDLDADNWANPDDQPDNIGPFDGSGDPGNTYPQYALVEEGIFTNALSDDYTINGKKLWGNLPSGYSDADLPAVTFEVYAEGADPDAKAVATLEISKEQWPRLKDGSSYNFIIEYVGENTLSVENGVLVCKGGENAERLPRYDDAGRQISYVVKEKFEITDAAGEDIYDVAEPGEAANFTFTNTYSSPKGELRVKKLLELPARVDDTTGGFPEINFTLKRSYTGNDGETVQDTRFSRSLTWTSAEVESAYNSALSPDANPLSWTGAFENLDIYAPNGSQYVYEVTETTLNGYTTYAAQGDVPVKEFNDSHKGVYRVDGLEAKENSEVQATFYNVYTDEEKISLTGTKHWNDYNDAMGLRPELPQGEVNSGENDVLGLTVERYVSGIAGSRQALEIRKDYTITYEKNPSNANQWTFTIKGADPAKELQKYSTSGKAWTYVVKEDPEKIPGYTMGSGGTWRKTVSDDGTEMMLTPTPLTNTLYTNTLFTKAWQDEGGNSIKEDYLGFDLTVTFKLQVKPGSGTWQDASNYFTKAGCGLEEPVLTSIKNAIKVTGATQYANDPFRATRTGRIDSAVWGGTNRFNNLPTVIPQTGGSSVKLTYRVVEESVAYGRQSQTITFENDAYEVGEGLVDSAKLVGNKTTNTISTTSLTVEKVWEDSNNIYDTRPGGDNVMTWESWFVVQRSTNGTDWKNVEIVRLYGRDTKQDDTEHWRETISDLPVSDYSGTTSTPYTYRVRELQPKDGGYTLGEDLSESIIEEDGKLLSGSGDYSVDYTEDSTTSKFTVTNTLNTRTASISAKKVWEPSAPANASVTMVLRRKIGAGQWQDVAGQSKTLNGPDWTAEWSGLPATINGQTVSYDVEERNVQPDSYILTEENGTITFVNTQSKSFTVEKLWVGETPAEGTTVQVALYRTTDKNLVGSVWGEAVPQDELKPDGEKRTATLNSENNWSAAFAKLPVEDKDGNAYTYYALELGSDGNPIAENGRFALNGKDYRADYEHETDATTIRNTPSASISGTKTWKDNGNAYETRPDTLQLTLERTTNPNAEQPQWKTVPVGTDGVTFHWTESGEKSDVWRGTFDNLPLYAPDGSAYTYRVREEAILHYEPDDASRDGALVKNNAFAIENTLVGSVNIQGTKTWEGEIGKQPELTLERRPAGSSEEWMPVANAEPVWSDTEKTTWTFTYANMDKYDEQGVLLEYRVRETVPNGYDVFYTDGTAEDTDAPDGAEETTVAGLQITNVRRVALSVEKFWNGEVPAKDAAVQVGLYRTTDPEMVGSAEGEAVTEEAQGTDGANRTAELNAENVWKATFAELPKYDAVHALYYYYALELNAEGKPVENDGKITYGESDYRVSYVFEDGVTEITNRQIAALSGTKTWVDGSDEARPDTLELTLRRTTEPDAENPVWETVDLEAENITLTWTDTDTDVWTYTYTDLPLNAPNGDAYTYAVAERVPDGWDVYYADTVPVDEAPALDKAEEAGDAESGEDAEAASVPARDRYLTNVRRGNLTVEKAVDGAYGDHEQAFAFSAVFRLPEDFTGEADGVYGTYTAAGSDEAEPIEFTDSTAEVTFTLRDGERIEFAGLPGGTDYRIAETDAYGHLSTSTGETGEIPAGTTAAAAFVNTREDDPFAGLHVLKTVSGTDGETDRAFHFTVTLADDSVNGTYGDMEFVNGAAQFALRDGEARTATGLPAGIGYTVTEEEANQDGYTTTVTGNTGTLEAGVTAQAAFDNARDKKAEPTPSAEPTPTAAPTPTAESTPTPKPEESDAVQTGDETDLSVPSMLFLMSVSGLTAAVVVRRRRRRARGATRK